MCRAPHRHDGRDKHRLRAGKSHSLSSHHVSRIAQRSRAKTATRFDLLRGCFARKTATTSLTPCTASESLFAPNKEAKNALSVCCSRECTPGRTTSLCVLPGRRVCAQPPCSRQHFGAPPSLAAGCPLKGRASVSSAPTHDTLRVHAERLDKSCSATHLISSREIGNLHSIDTVIPGQQWAEERDLLLRPLNHLRAITWMPACAGMTSLCCFVDYSEQSSRG